MLSLCGCGGESPVPPPISLEEEFLRPALHEFSSESWCTGCDAGFWIGRGKYHCKGCGRIFCDECTQSRVQLPFRGYSSAKVRVCNRCLFEADAMSRIAADNYVGRPLQSIGSRILNMSWVSTSTIHVSSPRRRSGGPRRRSGDSMFPPESGLTAGSSVYGESPLQRRGRTSPSPDGVPPYGIDRTPQPLVDFPAIGAAGMDETPPTGEWGPVFGAYTETKYGDGSTPMSPPAPFTPAVRQDGVEPEPTFSPCGRDTIPINGDGTPLDVDPDPIKSGLSQQYTSPVGS
eukprot:Hpha_TRINITY_DN13357_c0_g1::TRINITY_DN13357_c0_g1_i1::g.95312::m.95312